MYGLLKVSVPTFFCLALSELNYQVNVLYVAQKGNHAQIAGMGLAISLNAMTSVSISIGFGGVLETMVSQAFGAKQYQLCGEYLNKTVTIVLACFFVVALVFFNSASILGLIVKS